MMAAIVVRNEPDSGIAEDAVVHHAVQGVEDGLRAAEVHVGGEQGDGVIVDPVHAQHPGDQRAGGPFQAVAVFRMAAVDDFIEVVAQGCLLQLKCGWVGARHSYNVVPPTTQAHLSRWRGLRCLRGECLAPTSFNVHPARSAAATCARRSRSAWGWRWEMTLASPSGVSTGGRSRRFGRCGCWRRRGRRRGCGGWQTVPVAEVDDRLPAVDHGNRHLVRRGGEEQPGRLHLSHGVRRRAGGRRNGRRRRPRSWPAPPADRPETV